MIEIDGKYIVGRYYTKPKEPDTKYICIGFGQHPGTGANYVLGMLTDAKTGHATIQSELFKDVKFEPINH